MAIRTLAFSQNKDSVSMLSGTVLDVYYNFATGHTDTVKNNNWHIAFSVRKASPPLKTMQAVTVRINDGRSVEIYKSNTTINHWRNFDTSGWSNWPTFYNSDSSWDIGALNQDRNLSDPFDYGWGQYNQTSHNVEGSNIWLIAIVTSPVPGAPKTLKKLAVQSVVFDTAWIFTLSNVDGTDSTTMVINKSSFTGKMFAYVDVLNKKIIDREPLTNSWDIVFTRYKSLVTLFGQTLMYPVMGILQNPTASAAKLEAANAKNTAPANTLMFTDKYSTIGWDWKVTTTTPGAWPVRDSLAYFVKLGANNYWSLSFNEYYADGTMQYIKFNKTHYTTLTSAAEVSKTMNNINVYPNPATQLVNINAGFNENINLLNVTITDITGKEVNVQSFKNVSGVFKTEIVTSNLNRGLYFITLSVDGVLSSRKLIIE